MFAMVVEYYYEDFNEFYDDSWNHVNSKISYYMRNEILEDIEDLTQEFYMRMLKYYTSIPHKEYSPVLFKAYLNKAVYHQCCSFWKKRRMKFDEIDIHKDDFLNDFNVLDDMEYNQQVKLFLSRLTDKQRKVCILLMSGYKAKEIAELLNLSESAIKRRKEGIRKRYELFKKTFE